MASDSCCCRGAQIHRDEKINFPSFLSAEEDINHKSSIGIFGLQVIIMLTSALQKKWIMQLMVLIYLLLSFSAANATFWCQTDENPPQLEVNPIGQCQVKCSSDSELLQQRSKISQSANPFFSQVEDCLDSPAFTSTLPSSKSTDLLKKNPASPFDTTYLPHIPELNLGMTHLASRILPGNLLELQRLKVLRTVVLLR